MQNESVDVTVGRDPVSGLRLVQQNPNFNAGLTTVTGSVELVNAPDGALTSVILVVEDTFDLPAAWGEAPRGLRSPRTGSPDVSGSFSISGVPAGRYVVLAAYENDDLVRAPDTNAAGTDFVTVDVKAGMGNVDLAESDQGDGSSADDLAWRRSAGSGGGHARARLGRRLERGLLRRARLRRLR